MKRISAGLSGIVGVLVGVALTTATVMAQPTKSAKGTITAIGPSTVTVSVDGKDIVFNADAKTRITAPGGSTAKREAQAEGKAGVKIADVLKVGQGVVVDYHEAGMHAASIRALPAPPSPSAQPTAPAPATLKSAGMVSAVTSNSLVIKADGGDVTFTIDPKTEVVASGAGTATRAKKAAGEKTVITDFVAVGDMVAVNYTEAAGTKTAKSVRVTAKARK